MTNDERALAKPSASTVILRNKIERYMLKHGWSTAVARKLQKKHGIAPSTLYRHRQAILREWAEMNQIEDRDVARADMVRRLHGWQEEAAKAGKFGAVASLASVEARITGIEAPRHVQVSGEIKVSNVETIASRWGAPANGEVIDVEAEPSGDVALIEAG